jgi:aromatic ring hydroxylase
VLVPWERVFTYNRADMARAAADLRHLLGNVQAHIRLLVKLRFILGVMKGADANGILTVPACRTPWRAAMQVAMVEGLVEAENAKPESWPNGHIAQDRQAMYAAMTWTTRSYPGSMECAQAPRKPSLSAARGYFGIR